MVCVWVCVMTRQVWMSVCNFCSQVWYKKKCANVTIFHWLRVDTIFVPRLVYKLRRRNPLHPGFELTQFLLPGLVQNLRQSIPLLSGSVLTQKSVRFEELYL